MRPRRQAIIVATVLAVGIPSISMGFASTGTDPLPRFQDIDEVSLDDLLNIPITAVARHEQPIGEAPSSATVITASDIAASGYETIAQVLQGLAGFYVSDDLNYTSIGVRGFSPPGDYNMRMLVLVDGHPISDMIWASAGVGTDGPIDLDLVDRIEVVRGPGSALYGTSAILAVVQIITKAPERVGAVAGAATVGSFDRKGGRLTCTGPAGKQGGFLLSLSGMDRQGPDIRFPVYAAAPGGDVTNVDADRNERFYGKLRIGSLTMSALRAERTRHVPTGAWGTIFDDPATRAIDLREYGEVAYRIAPVLALDLSARIFVDRSSSCGYWPFDGSTDSSLGAAGRIVSYEGTDGLWGGGELRADWNASPTHRIVVGGGFHHHHGKIHGRYDSADPAEDRTTLDIEGHSRYFSAYAQEEFASRQDLAITAGLHYDHYSEWGGTVTPRVALVLPPFRRTRTKLIFGKGFRAPSFGEFNYDDGQTIQANHALGPEQVLSVEGVIERTWASSVWTRLSAYHNKIYDLIQIASLDNGMVEYRNTGEFTVHGVELDLRGVIRRDLVLGGAVSLQDSNDDRIGSRAPNSPSWTANGRVTKPFFGHRALVSLLGRFVGDRLGINGSAVAKAYGVADANLVWRTPVPGFRMDLKVENLADRAYDDPAWDAHLMNLIPQYRRTWRLEVRYEPLERKLRVGNPEETLER